MQLYNRIFAAVCASILVGSCSHMVYPEDMYQTKAVKPDGVLNEWDLPLRFGSSSGLAQYNVTNDKENLYVSLDTHDEATALKILRSGITIYIDPSSGKSKKMSVAFPLPNTTYVRPEKNANNNNGKTSRVDMEQGLLVQAITFSTAGFSGIENKLYDVSDKSKIAVAVASNNGNGLAYEAIIPMKYIFGNTEKITGHPVSVGIVINAMKNPGERVPNPAAGNGSQSGMGGRRGSGSGGGRMGGGGGGNYRRNTDNGNTAGNPNAPDRTSLYKADTNWYTFKLASKS